MIRGLVSVIVPVYNCEKYIENCVNSIIAQSYSKVEIILVNDGSTDKSEEICMGLEKRYSSVIFFSQVNSGVSVARNNGLSHSNGEFVMFVDADDEVDSELIYTLIKSMDERTDVVCCSYSILGMNQREDMFSNDIHATTPYEKAVFYKQLMDVTYGHPRTNATAIGVPWGKLYRKSIFEQNNLWFDSRLRRMQDNIMVMEAFCFARKVIYINAPLYAYRVDHISSYRTYSYSYQVYLDVLEKRHEFFKKHPEFLSGDVYGYYFYEHLNFLMMSIHYIVAQREMTRREKITTIKEVCENQIYSDVLRRKNSSVLSVKQQIQCFLYRHKMYSLLFEIYRFKYKL